jgi:uncharacterized protein (TIGR03437 family)
VHRVYSLFAALALGLPLCAQGSPDPTAPAYSAAHIVNSASGISGALAPNTIATIYGTNLSDGTTGVAGNFIPGSMLADEMAGIRVFVAGEPCGLYYVSPQQINFLIPADLRPGVMNLFVARDGLAGPQAQITVEAAGPGLFESAPGVVAALHSDGSEVTKTHPARAGETVVAYGTGFGATTPTVVSGMVNMLPAQLTDISSFQVLLNGTALPAASILYAGIGAPPGLYQVTFKLPNPVATNPEIRVAVGGQASLANIRLPLQ